MPTLSCNIIITPKEGPRYRMQSAESISIESSWDKLTDRATIVLPRRLMLGDKPATIGGPWKRGTQIDLELGYSEYEAKKTFSGYVISARPGDQVTLECEDAMFLLKQNNHNFYFKNANLKDVLAKVCPIPFVCPDGVTMGNFRVENATTAQVLKVLQENYELPAFVRAGTLYVGLRFWPALQKRVVVVMGENTDTEATSLEWYDKESARIQVEAIGIKPGKNDASKKNTYRVTVGDEGGDKRTMKFYGITSEAELRRMAEAELLKVKFTGYRGSLTLFGNPVVQHGDRIVLTDKLYNEHKGEYLVKSVSTSWGAGGYRQKIELDVRID